MRESGIKLDSVREFYTSADIRGSPIGSAKDTILDKLKARMQFEKYGKGLMDAKRNSFYGSSADILSTGVNFKTGSGPMLSVGGRFRKVDRNTSADSNASQEIKAAEMTWDERDSAAANTNHYVSRNFNQTNGNSRRIDEAYTIQVNGVKHKQPQ